MKKIFVILGTFLFAVAVFFACSSTLSRKLKDNLSEESVALFAAHNDVLYASLTTGWREEPYITNGKSEQKVKFAVVSVFLFENSKEPKLDVIVKINGVPYNLELEKHLITGQYMGDLEILIKDNQNVEITILDCTLALSCVSNNFITNYKKAIELGAKYLENEVNKMLENKNNKIEAFLKIVNNPVEDTNIYYWYFIVACSNGTQSIVVIDTMSNNLMAKF
ncbi:MAG: hypothetical protein ACOX6H_01650 [Christensenellales bacterium]|jgi:hypothetical protein